MTPSVLGVSGSPVPNSNTDRLVGRILEATGLECEFVKLSELDLHPCKARLACAKTNVCTGFADDWGDLAMKVVRADALVVGGWMPFGILDAHTKMFLERTYCLRHSILLNAGKVGVAVITGTVDPNPAADDVLDYFRTEGLEPLGKLLASGIDPCWSCGLGEVCVQGGTLPMLLSGYQVYKYPYADRLPPVESFKIVPEIIPPVIEEQPDVLEEAARLGRLIAGRLDAEKKARVAGLESLLPGVAAMPSIARLNALAEVFAGTGRIADDALAAHLLRLLASAAHCRAEGENGKAVVALLTFARKVLLTDVAITREGRDILVAEARRAANDCYVC